MGRERGYYVSGVIPGVASPVFELFLTMLDGCAALLGVLSATIVSFHEVSPTAAYLLVPYFGWSLFAAGLTLSIYKKNPRVGVPCYHCHLLYCLAAAIML